MKNIRSIVLVLLITFSLIGCSSNSKPPEPCSWYKTDFYINNLKLYPPATNKPYSYQHYFGDYIASFQEALHPNLSGSKIVITVEAMGCTGTNTQQKTYSVSDRKAVPSTTLTSIPVTSGRDHIGTVMVVAGPMLASNGKSGYVFWEKRFETVPNGSPDFMIAGVYKQDVDISKIYKNGTFK